MAVTKQSLAWLFGAAADRPTGKTGETYFATDTLAISICTADTTWVTIGSAAASIFTIPTAMYPTMPFLSWGTGGAPGFINEITLNASGDKLGFVFEATKAGNIHKLHWRVGTVVTAKILDVRLETVDPATGLPTGTLWAANTNGAVAATYVSGDWITVTLTADGTVAKNDKFAVVINVTEAGSNFNNATSIGITGGSSMAFPYVCDGSTGTFSSVTAKGAIVAAIEYSDGSFAYIPGTNPVTTVTTLTFSSASTPDEQGLMFQLPISVRLSGFWFWGDIDNDTEVVLYDSDGTTVIETVTIDKDIRGGTAGPLVFRQFVTQHTLLANTNYRLVFKPGAATIISYRMDYNSAAMLNQMSPGQTFTFTSRTDAGAWSQTLASRPTMGILVDGILSL